MNDLEELRQQVEHLKQQNKILTARVNNQSTVLLWETRKTKGYEEVLKLIQKDRNAPVHIQMEADTVLEMFKKYQGGKVEARSQNPV
jgi:hypothetical protein